MHLAEERRIGKIYFKENKMSRQNFFDLTVEGDELDPIAAKEIIGLPCELYYKGKASEKRPSGREIVSISTRWVYSENSTGKTEPFLMKQLKIILQKMPKLEEYIKKYNAYLEITIYEDDAGKEFLLLNTKIIKLLNEIGVKFWISFKNLEAIYGKDVYCIKKNKNE